MKFFEKYRSKQRMLSELWDEYKRRKETLAAYADELMNESDEMKQHLIRGKMLEAARKAVEAKDTFDKVKKMKF